MRLRRDVKNSFVAIAICLTVTTQSLATCDARLKACDDALNAALVEIEQLHKIRKVDQEVIDKLMEQRNRAIAEMDTGSDMPWYLWTVLGIAGGVVITRGLR